MKMNYLQRLNCTVYKSYENVKGKKLVANLNRTFPTWVNVDGMKKIFLNSRFDIALPFFSEKIICSLFFAIMFSMETDNNVLSI